MKKTISAILMLAMLLSVSVSQLHVSASDPPTASAIKGSPTVDGNLAEWEEVPSYPFAQKIAGNELVEGWFKMMWDEGGLYIAAEFEDLDDGGNAENGGNTELFSVLFDFDGLAAGEEAVPFAEDRNAGYFSYLVQDGTTWTPAGNENPGPYNGKDGSQSTLLATGVDIMGDPAYDAADPAKEPLACSFKPVLVDGKWRVESKWVPSTAELKAKLAEGTEIGFDARVSTNWCGAAQDGESVTGWASDAATTDIGLDLRKLGKVTLTVPKVETPIETPTGTAIKGSPMLNGDLSDWADAPAIPFSKEVSGTKVEGWFKMMWDETGIYVGAEYTDPDYEKDDDPTNLISLLFDFDGVAQGDEPVTFSENRNAGIFSFIMGAWMPGPLQKPEVWDGFGKEMKDAGNPVMGDGENSCFLGPVYNAETGKWAVETYWVPANAELKAKLAEGTEIGFDIRLTVNYTDANKTGTGIVSWASDAEYMGDDLRRAGKITLTGPAQIVPLEPTEGNPGANTPVDADITADSILLGWNAAEGAASYRVNIFKVTTENNEKKYTYLKSDESIIGASDYVIDLEASTTYAFQVIAYDESANKVAVYDMIEVTTKAAGGTTTPGGDGGDGGNTPGGNTPGGSGDGDKEPDGGVPSTSAEGMAGFAAMMALLAAGVAVVVRMKKAHV